ncbi:Asp-tRNA(Asn)/Glu-tRNA(Gln) amidotransferase subunit GatB [Allofustis seminis]|uniref:Asp-tRNA(Asn)/Glu-tRNA(Gln) amidotransferase subunit GatB n=1 Tax=Allofustis seminis TaxID=166939 RepID=UPI00037C21F3|nr:Asp-tRNA(Asn)/Glu-tRNA(Gln) amidotransferase subunit GatB [Allofustis seminis]
MNFETIIGLEVHAELNANSKMFSPAPATFGAEPNSNTNVIDWAYPGVLPTPNRAGIDLAIKAALALNCKIHQDTRFDRKNYFYPDNPSAYQKTQDKYPIGYDGWIEIEVKGKTKKIRIERVHLEEDAGKNTHGTDGYSYVDLNRQGSCLLEIVSEADMRTPDEAYAYLENLKQIIQFTKVSDVKMEEGSMRCDANISLRPYGQEAFGVKSELKNLNSFNNVRKGLNYEQARHEKALLAGEQLLQETRRFDASTGETILMRIKETKDDYRYFPEPDILPVKISDEWIEQARQSLPEMPKARRQRYVEQFNIPSYDAQVLTATVQMSGFFEEMVEFGADPKQASNWLMGEVSAYLNKEQIELDHTTLTPNALAQMIALIKDGTISSKIAKKVFVELTKQVVEDVNALVEEKGWVQLSDPKKLLPIIEKVLDQNEQSIIDYREGKDRALGFLVGQIMKETRGKANPGAVNQLLKQEIDKR